MGSGPTLVLGVKNIALAQRVALYRGKLWRRGGGCFACMKKQFPQVLVLRGKFESEIGRHQMILEKHPPSKGNESSNQALPQKWFCQNYDGETLLKKRHIGFNFLCPPRAAYFCARYDNKARAETNNFQRWYSCKFMCERCMAQRPTAKATPDLLYTDFSSSAVHTMTTISDATYRLTERKI